MVSKTKIKIKQGKNPALSMRLYIDRIISSISDKETDLQEMQVAHLATGADSEHGAVLSVKRWISEGCPVSVAVPVLIDHYICSTHDRGFRRG
jgi:hypothetical protein